MIINLSNAGQAQILTPDHIYKGSAGVNSIDIIGPLPSSTAISVAFVLPSGVTTVYAPATLIGAVTNIVDETGAPVYQWRYALPLNILSESGQVGVAINAIATNGNQTSYLTTFTVETSVLPDLPAQPDQDVYTLILQYLAQDQAAITNLKIAIFGADNIPTNDSGYDIELNPRVETLEGEMETAQANILELQSDLETAEGNISNLQGRMTTAEGNISANAQAIAAETANRESADNALSGRIDNTYTKAEVDTSQGNQNTAIAVNTSDISSLDERIELLELQVAPRANVQTITYDAPTNPPSAELISLMTAAFSGNPDNTSRCEVIDNTAPNDGEVWIYDYYTGFEQSDNIPDGWYFVIKFAAPSIEIKTVYTKYITLGDWGAIDANGYYNIEIPNSVHNKGANAQLDVTVLVVDGATTYAELNCYTISTAGLVNIYSTEKFAGIAIISEGGKISAPVSTVEIGQVNGLTAALAALDTGKQDTLTFDTTPTNGSTNPVTSGGIYAVVAGKQNSIPDVAIISTQSEFDALLLGNGWGKTTIINGLYDGIYIADRSLIIPSDVLQICGVGGCRIAFHAVTPTYKYLIGGYDDLPSYFSPRALRVSGLDVNGAIPGTGATDTDRIKYFYNIGQVENCSVQGMQAYNIGFYNCQYVSNCFIRSAALSTDIHGFKNCNRVMCCYVSFNSSIASYTDCYGYNNCKYGSCNGFEYSGGGTTPPVAATSCTKWSTETND